MASPRPAITGEVTANTDTTTGERAAAEPAVCDLDGATTFRLRGMLVIILTHLRGVDGLGGLERQTSDPGTRHVVLDVTALGAIGNDAVLALCAVARGIQRTDTAVTIAGLDDRARLLLTLSSSDRVTLTATLGDALTRPQPGDDGDPPPAPEASTVRPDAAE